MANTPNTNTNDKDRKPGGQQPTGAKTGQPAGDKQRPGTTTGSQQNR